MKSTKTKQKNIILYEANKERLKEYQVKYKQDNKEYTRIS